VSHKFILTSELGKLARWLRILGFDAEYDRSDNPSALIIKALREERVVLTRRKARVGALGKRAIVVCAEGIGQQLQQVIKELNLGINKDKMFTRCARCNQLLAEAEKSEVRSRAPARVFETQDILWSARPVSGYIGREAAGEISKKP